MDSLGHVYVKVLMGDPKRIKTMMVSMLADTGATYACIPVELAQELNLRIDGESEVVLADGKRVRAGVAHAHMEIADRSDIVSVRVFDVEEPLLGVFALEALGLSVDPVSGEIKPTRGFIARA